MSNPGVSRLEQALSVRTTRRSYQLSFNPPARPWAVKKFGIAEGSTSVVAAIAAQASREGLNVGRKGIPKGDGFSSRKGHDVCVGVTRLIIFRPYRDDCAE